MRAIQFTCDVCGNQSTDIAGWWSIAATVEHRFYINPCAPDSINGRHVCSIPCGLKLAESEMEMVIRDRVTKKLTESGKATSTQSSPEWSTQQLKILADLGTLSKLSKSDEERQAARDKYDATFGWQDGRQIIK